MHTYLSCTAAPPATPVPCRTRSGHRRRCEYKRCKAQNRADGYPETDLVGLAPNRMALATPSEPSATGFEYRRRQPRRVTRRQQHNSQPHKETKVQPRASIARCFPFHSRKPCFRHTQCNPGQNSARSTII